MSEGNPTYDRALSLSHPRVDAFHRLRRNSGHHCISHKKSRRSYDPLRSNNRVTESTDLRSRRQHYIQSALLQNWKPSAVTSNAGGADGELLDLRLFSSWMTKSFCASTTCSRKTICALIPQTAQYRQQPFFGRLAISMRPSCIWEISIAPKRKASARFDAQTSKCSL